MIETVMGMLKNHYKLKGKVGGWIYRADGTPLAHGWVSFADLINKRGIVLRHSPFVDWERADKLLKSRISAQVAA